MCLTLKGLFLSPGCVESPGVPPVEDPDSCGRDSSKIREVSY